MENQVKSNRLDYLDSLRGIAALMVCFGHYINWQFHESQTIKIASIILNPNDAVSFFFVLSGMVLSYPYLQLHRKLDIKKFFVARIFRIFPSYLIALIILTLYASRDNLGAPSLFKIFFLNRTQFWTEAVLILGINKLYLPGWTLTIELCVSFFMPFFILVAKQNRKLLPWLLLAVFICSKIMGLFLFHFILGIIITAYFNEIRQLNFRQTWFYKNRIFILLLAIPVFSLRQIVYSTPLGTLFGDSMYFVKLIFFILSGLAAFVFIIFLIHSEKAQKIFQHSVLVFFGKISYGVYLMHFIFVCAIWDNWRVILHNFQNEKVAFVVMMLVCFISTTITATLLHYIIELPFIKYGKRVGNKIKSSVQI